MMGRVLACLSLICILTGCGKKGAERSAEKAVERAIQEETGEKADVHIADEKISVKTKDGNFEMASGKSARIPDNFPSDVFVYPKAAVEMTMGDDVNRSLILRSSDSVQKVKDAYQKKMSNSGWTEDAAVTMEGNAMFAFSKGDRKVNVTIHPEEKTTLINLLVATEQ